MSLLLPKRALNGVVVRLTQRCSARAYQKCSTNDPASLTCEDVGKHYDIPVETTKALNFNMIAPSTFNKQIRTLKECTILCRNEFLEVVNCLNAVRPSFPPLRIVLWGKFGTGKTMTLVQAIHFAHSQNWVIFNVRDAMDWTRKVEALQMSTYKPGRIDQPQHALTFLQHFKHQNQHMWKQLAELKTERDYIWTKAEKTPQDRPITDIVEMGIASPFMATDCFGALARELRRHAHAGSIKLLVAADGANSFYGKTLIRKADRTFATHKEVTLLHQVKKFFQDDWSNGAVLLIADKREISDARNKLEVPLNTPIELFTEEGFEDIDPFIPIQTNLYSESEAKTVHEYYKEKNWLVTEDARSNDGMKQMYYLSAFNPFHFERLCAFN